MKISYGFDANAKRQNKIQTVEWNEETAVNGHKLLVGMSGAGKSFTMQAITAQLAATANPTMHIHVFDTEGDLNMPGASEVMFSEQSEFGLNPLELNTDPHMGGPRKATEKFIRTVNSSGRPLGSKQEYLVRQLVMETYVDLGFDPEDPFSWPASSDQSYVVDYENPDNIYLDIAFSEREEAKRVAKQLRWDGTRKSWFIHKDHYHGGIAAWPRKQNGKRYPTLKDVIRKADLMAKQHFLGTTRQSVIELEEVHKQAKAIQNSIKGHQKAKKGENIAEAEKFQEKFHVACEKAKASFCKHLETDLLGDELEISVNYVNKDTIQSVKERLENLHSSGIFKSTPPNFDPNATIWRYQLKALSLEEKRMFIGFMLSKYIEQAYTNGEMPCIQNMFIVDEAHYFFDQDPMNPLNVIAKVGRKFGMGLISASQSVEHFGKDFLSSVSTIVVLGLNKPFWPDAVKKLGLREDALRWIKIKQTAMIQITDSATGQGVWYPTILQGATSKKAENVAVST